MKQFVCSALFLTLTVLSCSAAQPAELPILATTSEQPAPLRQSIELKTIWGPVTVTDAVVIELLEHKAVQRLKGVDQHGPSSYFRGTPTFTRYEHCVGVYALLKRFGADIALQIAGLLHDASHTIMSHFANRFFKTGNMHAYQDSVHAWYLEQMGVGEVLQKYGMSIDDVMPEQYLILKNKQYQLSADRIEYNLHTGLAFGRITQEQAEQILNDLRVDDGGTWYFVSQEPARLIADQSVYFTEHFWSSGSNVAEHHWAVSAVRQLVARELITSDDIHFGQDEKVVNLLRNSTDKHIQEMLTRCTNPEKYFTTVSPSQEHNLLDQPKNRSINPLVLQEDGSKVRLTELDPAFKAEYERVKQYCQTGIRIKLHEAPKTGWLKYRSATAN